MKFQELCIGCRKCRVGSLSFSKNSNAVFETPLMLVETQGGTVPHLTKDVLHKILPDECILSVPSSHFIQSMDVLKAFQKGASDFIGMKTHPMSVSVQDSFQNTPSGYNGAKNVSVWTYGGRVGLCSKKYNELIEQMIPQWYECLHDSDVDENSTEKRRQKSVRNSLNYLEQCLNLKSESEVLTGIPLFGPLLGGYNCEERAAWSEKLSTYPLDGYSLHGLHKNGDAAELVDVSLLRPLVEASMKSLSSRKPVQALGAYSPLCVLELIECGCDIFDSSLSHLLAERSCAFTFPNVLKNVSSEDCDLSSEENTNLHGCEDDRISFDGTQSCDDKISDSDSISSSNKRPASNGDHPIFKIPRHDPSPDKNYRPKAYEINMKNEIYADAKVPIVENCSCYTCQHFSKAYIHHLISVNELLGPQLLMMHNLHHWHQFFVSIQHAIRTGKMEELKKALLQCS